MSIRNGRSARHPPRRAGNAKPSRNRGEDRGALLLRALLILRALETSRAGVTKAALLELIEGERSERTLYRYIKTLRELGYSIRSTNGRYRLEKDHAGHSYQLPMTSSEAVGLSLAEDLMAPLGASFLGESLRAIRRKVLAGLSENDRRHSELLRKNLAATVLAPIDYTAHATTLDAIHEAIQKEHLLRLRYAGPAKPVTERLVEPYLLRYVQGRAYLVAHCRSAADKRIFAVQRIESAEVLDEPFDPDEAFDPHRYVEQSFGVFQGPVHAVVIDFHPGVAHHARERRFHPSQRLQERPDGWLRLTFDAAGLPEIAAWLAGYGGKAHAVSPPELVDAVEALHRDGLKTENTAPERARPSGVSGVLYARER